MTATRVIEIEIYRPQVDARGEPTGYLEYAGQKTIGEVFREIETVLKETPTGMEEHRCSLHDLLDYFGWTSHEKGWWQYEQPMPRCRWVTTYVVRGGSEGWYIHVDATGIKDQISYDMEKHVPLLLGKTFCGLEAALKVAGAITALFHS